MPDIACVDCRTPACADEDVSKTPEICPRRLAAEALERADEIRTTDPDVLKLLDAATAVAREGKGNWPRVQEVVAFARQMGHEHIGVGFCSGLRDEAEALADILRSHGFRVSSVACTVNEGCNPIGQALVLNHAQTDLNILVGACMGHDVLFGQYCQAPTTVLVAKDRVTVHNTAAPLLNKRWKSKLKARA
jgi:uncharacterized metal-binding protein